ncbi:trans-1,2-dihydrobenzene-1,2-diol dehydrogenase-like [Lineus longissimus]|uniref:trans-1,2-dihydrobenzene-1,2-diol dehydrogenase-like n=1 Tax=Lineus longissimus TaxID=88925 RepID=UPI002B4E4226
MATPTRWGLCAAGAISNDFTIALKCLPASEHQVACVAARNLSRAQEFAKKFDIPKVYGSYQELAADENLDIIYIGVIHPAHYEICKLMINAGKNILCEKPMTMCKRQTQELVDLAKEKNVFLMEALWSRFLPAYEFIRKELKAGTIGEPKYLTAEFCVDLSGYNLERLTNKDFGAGALVDLGPYTVGMAMWAFDDEYPEQIVASGHLNNEGFDVCSGAVFKFSKGRLACITQSCTVDSGSQAFIYGTKGKIEVKFPMWTPSTVIVNDKAHTFPPPESPFKTNFVNSTNLSFEARAVRECLLAGQKECGGATHEYSLKLISIIDELKRQLGVQYDCDKV